MSRWRVGLSVAGVAVSIAIMANAMPVETEHSVVPSRGFVPDAATAMRIAEAVWIPIYGEARINSERPFTATLSNGVWAVEGYLAPHLRGGVALAEISKADGRILRVTHSK